MSLERKEIFEFGEFRLDVDEHTIERIDGTRNGTLTEKAFQTLILLIRQRGHLVSKDELIRHVWPDTIVEDNNLEKCIHQLRQFLGEKSDGSKYIETVRKHGYRFVGKVQVIEVSRSWLPASFSGSTVVERSRSPFRTAFMLPVMLVVVIGGIAALGYYLLFRSGAETNAVEIQAKRGTNNDEAYQLYFQAINLSEERGVQNVLKSLEYLDQAVALDPDFASAWAAKARTHGDIVGQTDSGQHEHFQKSMEAISKALFLDPNSSDAYSALCHRENRYEYDVMAAETACKRALDLDPNSPVAHKTYANFLYTRGRFDEAIVEIKTAMDLQPVSYRNQQMYALTLYYARRYGEAEEQFKRLIELNPNHSYILERLVRVLEEQGREREAFEYLIKKLTLQKAGDEEIQRHKTAYQTSGWRGVIIEQIKTKEADADPGSFDLAGLYAKVGDKDKAFEYLEKAYQKRSFLIAILQVDPQLDSLHGDPRFKKLAARVGF